MWLPTDVTNEPSKGGILARLASLGYSMAAYLMSAPSDGTISMHKSLSDIDRSGRKRCLPRTRINEVDGREWSAGFGGITEVLSIWGLFSLCILWGSVGGLGWRVCACAAGRQLRRPQLFKGYGTLSISNCSMKLNMKKPFAAFSEVSLLRILNVISFDQAFLWCSNM